MRFSTSTVAYAALFLSTAEAAPFWGFGHRHSGERNSTEGNGRGSGREDSDRPSFPSGIFPSQGGAFPTGGFGGSRPSGGFGGFPSGFPSGGFSGFPGGDEPAETGFPGFPGGDEPTETGFPGGEFPVPGESGIATGPAPTEAPTLPTGGAGRDVSSVSFELPSTAEAVAAEDDEDSSSESKKSTKTKKSKSKTKTKTTEAAATATGGSDSDSEEGATSAAPSATSGSGSGSEETITAPAPTSGSGSGSGSSNGTTPSTGSGATANGNFPTATGEETLNEPMVIAAGETFDGGLKRYGRGVSCSGQSEGGDSDAVFQVEEGGTLKNVIIGADQVEGVHCMGQCNIENVWWEAVCEDALTIKQESGTSTVTGGGAQGAEDKVIQHNGGGTVAISGFYVSDFGKLYRSCGNCKTMYERHVTVDGVLAEGGSSTFVGINSNYGDTATITNSCITGTKKICEEFEGNDTGDEPTSIGDGPSAACIYTDADINAC